MNQNPSVRKLVRCGVVAAIYVVLCMALQPLSYGAVQVRVAEALCLLPVFGAEYIAGVVLGCFLANLLGSTIVDVIFGTLATLLACLVTYKLRNIRIKGLAVGEINIIHQSAVPVPEDHSVCLHGNLLAVIKLQKFCAGPCCSR